MEEAELVTRMIADDRDAFADLMDRYQGQALRAAYLICGNHADSEDIVQETFVSCYVNRSQIRSPESFRGWFYKTLSRNAWKLCRKQKKELPAEEVWSPEKPAPGELLTDLIAKEEADALYAAVLKLPVKQRIVIVLYFYSQMSIREIARACGCMEGTVKSRLFHGKAKLKKALEQNEQKGEATWTILS